MITGGIDSNRIQAMLAQLKVAAQRPETATSGAESVAGLSSAASLQKPQATTKVDFSDALKASLDQVSKAQSDAQTMGKNFALGDDSVSLSDVMIAGQKASISFQATVQVRNKLVSAYQDIMNMQV